MQIRIRHSLLLLVLMAPFISTQLNAQSYAIAEMSDEATAAVRPFSISRVVPIIGGLRLFIITSDPDAVSRLVNSGSLLGQLSDHNILTVAPVSISLRKAVTCSPYAMPFYLAYEDQFPYCGYNPPVRIEYFIRAITTLGPGRDLAIGQDPDFLWLIEER